MKSLPLLLLLLLPVLCWPSSASTPDLRDQHLLQSVQAADLPSQGWTWQTIEKLLSQPQGGATEHMELQRSADLSPAQPTRKAGCRHVYWKGPTAC
ncbi:somatostatin-2-like [Scleropages formosus]|uniref:somatostatin-2-like n=1 Tax=Scleropages formosus TaxID=113540 RepID=UPI0010FA94F7|nr:somatostatin-2-like [Scleropages formosus]XP_029104834.1 somatostatin-2-like [Scleropages formosus]